MRISDWSSDVCSSDLDLAPRRVRIDAVRLVAMPDADHAEFAVVCRRGAYMRALARDIARTLGTAGHVGALRRTQVGPFLEADALSDRKSVGAGKSGSVRVGLGGCRSFKKKKKT